MPSQFSLDRLSVVVQVAAESITERHKGNDVTAANAGSLHEALTVRESEQLSRKLRPSRSAGPLQVPRQTQ